VLDLKLTRRLADQNQIGSFVLLSLRPLNEAHPIAMQPMQIIEDI